MAEVDTSTQVCVYSERAVIYHKVWCDKRRKDVWFLKKKEVFHNISVMA